MNLASSQIQHTPAQASNGIEVIRVGNARLVDVDVLRLWILARHARLHARKLTAARQRRLTAARHARLRTRKLTAAAFRAPPMPPLSSADGQPAPALTCC
eukprot:1160695-Pelagomonas_calceolata.AAC.7